MKTAKRTINRSIRKTPVSKPQKTVIRSAPRTPQVNLPRFTLPIGLPREMFTITQDFDVPVDYSNLNPNRYQRHEGVDFAPVGSARDMSDIPVLAVQNAVVTQVRTNPSGYGRYVRLEFDDNVFGAIYAHLDNINVAVGQHVNAGDVIGTMGNSGRSTGRHLHFNLLDLRQSRGNYIYPQVINPMPFLTGSDTQAVAPLPRESSYKPQDRPIQQISKPKIQVSVRQQDGGDYPPGMPGTSNDPIPAREQAHSSSAFDNIQVRGMGINPQFGSTDVIGTAQGLTATGFLAGLTAQGLNEKGEFDLLQAIGLGTGDEREEYIKKYAPYIVLSLVGIALILVGVARLVFNPNPLK